MKKNIKEEFRRKCLDKLCSQSDHSRVASRHRINRMLDKTVKGAQAVLLFWPLPIEADVRPLIHRLRRERKRVYVPFMEGESFRMVPFRYPLKRKRFGIFEPGLSTIQVKKIDIAVVPAVGVDAQGRRIGFGKGMYDRFFAALKNKPEIIFVQSMPCVSNEKIGDDHDVAATLLLTPTACFSTLRNHHVNRNSIRRHRRFSQRCHRFFHREKDVSGSV